MRPIMDRFPPTIRIAQPGCDRARQEHANCGRFAAARMGSHGGLAFPAAGISINGY
jgi:hypothetical protein